MSLPGYNAAREGASRERILLKFDNWRKQYSNVSVMSEITFFSKSSEDAKKGRQKCCGTSEN